MTIDLQPLGATIPVARGGVLVKFLGTTDAVSITALSLHTAENDDEPHFVQRHLGHQPLWRQRRHQDTPASASIRGNPIRPDSIGSALRSTRTTSGSQPRWISTRSASTSRPVMPPWPVKLRHIVIGLHLWTRWTAVERLRAAVLDDQEHPERRDAAELDDAAVADAVSSSHARSLEPAHPLYPSRPVGSPRRFASFNHFPRRWELARRFSFGCRRPARDRCSSGCGHGAGLVATPALTQPVEIAGKVREASLLPIAGCAYADRVRHKRALRSRVHKLPASRARWAREGRTWIVGGELRSDLSTLDRAEAKTTGLRAQTPHGRGLPYLPVRNRCCAAAAARVVTSALLPTVRRSRSRCGVGEAPPCRPARCKSASDFIDSAERGRRDPRGLAEGWLKYVETVKPSARGSSRRVVCNQLSRARPCAGCASLRNAAKGWGEGGCTKNRLASIITSSLLSPGQTVWAACTPEKIPDSTWQTDRRLVRRRYSDRDAFVGPELTPGSRSLFPTAAARRVLEESGEWLR